MGDDNSSNRCELSPELYSRFPMTKSWELSAQLMDTTVFGLFQKVLTVPTNFSVIDVKGAGNRENTYSTVMMVPGHHWRGSYGPVASDVMVIGKRPGADEQQFSRNLVGPAGQELADLLNKRSVIFDKFYITNVVRFVPPDGGKTLKAYHIKDCAPLLGYELDVVRPKYLLLLGVDAIKFLFGKRASLTNMRGADLYFDPTKLGAIPSTNAREAPGAIRTVATVNPAHVLREPSMRVGFEQDIERFVAMINGDSTSESVRGIDTTNYTYIYNHDDLNALVNRLIANNEKKFAIDCEWGGENSRVGQLRTVQFCWKVGHAAVIVLREAGGHWVFGNEPSTELQNVVKELQRLFDRPDVKLIGHNFRADAPWLEDLGVHVMDKLWFDTMLADHLLNENVDHTLSPGLSTKYTTLGRYDFELERWVKENKHLVKSHHGYMNIPDELLLPYAAADADATFQSFIELTKILDRPENDRLHGLFYDIVMPANQPIFEMETTGFLVDADRMISMLKQYVSRKFELLAELRNMIHMPNFNPRSFQHKVTLLFGVPEDGGLALTPIKTTEKPTREWSRVMNLPVAERARLNPSVDSEVLELLASDDDISAKSKEIVTTLQNFQVIDQVTKNFLRPPKGYDMDDLPLEREIYVDGLLGHIDTDGRIRTRISQTKETGRYGSSDPNMQNLTKRRESAYKQLMGDDVPSIRSNFVASPGCVFIEADYKSAEIFGLAYVSGDQQLIADASGKIKLHAKVAVDVLKAPCGYAEVAKAFPHLYVAAKNLSFGIPYQRGAKAIARQINRETKGAAEMTDPKAQELIDAWYDRYKLVRAYVNYVKHLVRTPPHIIENAYGRQRRFYFIDDESVMAAQEREGVNFPIQSIVADTLSKALVNLYYYKKANPWCNYRILLAIHDAVMLEVPIPIIEHVIDFVLPLCMRHAAQVPVYNFNLDIDPEIMLRWGEEPSRDELKLVGVPEKYWPEEE